MRKLFFANWKMYLTDAGSEALARVFVDSAAKSQVETIIAPGFTVIERVARIIEGSSVGLGAQDAFWKDEGAYTGEVSPRQLFALGVQYVIVGHSERRSMGESSEIVAKKASAVAADGMVPVLCVGETKQERDEGRMEEVVNAQLAAVLGGWSSAQPLIVAYEPRWAIGTGVACRPQDVAVMHAMIRGVMESAGLPSRILYGGSVDPKNAKSYLELDDVAGLLVGGASTKVEDVRALIELLSE
jgi:triosephosphate isomerase